MYKLEMKDIELDERFEPLRPFIEDGSVVGLTWAMPVFDVNFHVLSEKGRVIGIVRLLMDGSFYGIVGMKSILAKPEDVGRLIWMMRDHSPVQD